MDKNIKIANIEPSNANVTLNRKDWNKFAWWSTGIPVLPLNPPGAVKAAANTTVAIKVATSMR
ncbi:hypothetical protein CDL12_10192 [Handroanthus impetiginosus]|uniref:Uncharacterized protein n=1 Tax=Handroanthus impetiginosus TaxID=429701 RepID=A0A2G9HHX3_9LAMI|nr:hypothetical protein CDL12_10192 [Handroanthus impetiginosus]